MQSTVSRQICQAFVLANFFRRPKRTVRALPQLKIAQRFSAGINVPTTSQVPSGTAEAAFVLPDSIRFIYRHPALKRWAIIILKALRPTNAREKFLVCNHADTLLMKRVPRVSP